jgi:predicted nucleic acid-binding Zn ribbon protein
MALTKCKECGHLISRSATACPNCGAKIKRTSLFTKIVAVVFGFVALLMYLGHKSGEKYQAQQAAQQAAQREAEQIGLKWNYQESDEKMGRGKIKSAFVKSLNQVEFGFPYQGAQRATLQLRNHPKYGKDVILIIERGQFLCQIDVCNIAVRFGDGEPQTFRASEPTDHSTEVLFINDHDRFVANTKKVKKVYIEAQFFQEGTRVFEFDVSDLNWP